MDFHNKRNPKKEDIKITPKKKIKNTRVSQSSNYLWSIKKWFFHKTHHYSKLRKQDFMVHLVIFIGVSLVFWTIYSNIDLINEITFWIFKLGSLIELILFITLIVFLYKILKNIRYGFRGLQNGYKIITLMLFLIICFSIYQNPHLITQPLTTFNYNSLNPIEVNFTRTDNGNNDYYGGNDWGDWENKGYVNPSYTEMINFINEDKTNSNEYIYPSYVCHNFAVDTIDNAGLKNLRAGYVFLDSYQYGMEDHAIVCFDTSDKGLYFLEPQWDYVFSLDEMNNMLERGRYDITITRSDGWIEYFDSELYGYEIQWWND